MADLSGLVIAAPSSGAGKTFVTLALLRALRDAGYAVGSAKAGPDYIDPRFHEAATGKPCPNLDAWAMRPGLVQAITAGLADGCNLVLVEGVMGLFDGAEAGEGSTADLAAQLGFPVVLVVDAMRQAQSVAALVSGFARFRDDCRITGIILNRIASPRHRAILEAALAPLEIPVLGAFVNDTGFQVPSRHLGLVQAAEHEDLDAFLKNAGEIAARSVDLEALAGLARPFAGAGNGTIPLAPLGQRMAVASDAAFSFAYPHLMAGWRRAGAEILPFSPLADEAPDERADAVYLPGGYPELHGERLAACQAFLGGLRDAAARGALIYGECGGFMVLGETLVDERGSAHPMAGLLPVATSFEKRKLNLGYRHLTHDGMLPWPARLRGHEFHYSRLLEQGAGDTLFAATDSAGRQLPPMGLRRNKVMGSYAHVIDAARGEA